MMRAVIFPLRPFLFLLCFSIFLTPLISVGQAPLIEPRNVIIMIGDGMGPEQIKAARYYSGKSLSFESMPYRASVSTHNADGWTTDSAAAATAIATGTKVHNGVISLALPGDGSELTTLLEYFKARGRSTGLVTTTNITNATPAGFGSHTDSRYNSSEIASDYLTQTKPNVLFGGGGSGLTHSDAQAAGYLVVDNLAELLSVDTDSVSLLSGQFGTSSMPYEYDGLGSLPHLSDMTTVALDILDKDPDGFFLMIEGGRIDHACHQNDINRAIPETIEFSQTVTAVLNWYGQRSDTLILVTADHETGGLTVVSDQGAGHAPSVTWSTEDHTDRDVNIYAQGYGAKQFYDQLDNTDIFSLVTTAGYSENQAPSVEAGEDFTAVPQTSVSLSGSVTDDGISLPLRQVTLSWSKESGAGEVAFSDTASSTSTVSFSVVGDYRLRLTADDGLAQSYDEVTVRVGAILYGDVSGNGSITAYDASLAAQYAVGLISLDSEQIAKADVSGNGSVSATDAAWIARKAVDPTVVFPVE